MGTIPAFPTKTAGALLTAADWNAAKAASDFWASKPQVYAYQAVAQNLATSGAEVAVNLDAELFDIVQSGDSQSHDNVTSNTRIVVRTTGKYRITAQVTFATNATGYRQARVKVNAAGNPAAGTELGLSVQSAVSGLVTSVPLLVPICSLVAGDHVELFGLQTSTAALALNVSSPGRTFLAIELIAA